MEQQAVVIEPARQIAAEKVSPLQERRKHTDQGRIADIEKHLPDLTTLGRGGRFEIGDDLGGIPAGLDQGESGDGRLGKIQLCGVAPFGKAGRLALAVQGSYQPHLLDAAAHGLPVNLRQPEVLRPVLEHLEEQYRRHPAGRAALFRKSLRRHEVQGQSCFGKAFPHRHSLHDEVPAHGFREKYAQAGFGGQHFEDELADLEDGPGISVLLPDEVLPCLVNSGKGRGAAVDGAEADHVAPFGSSHHAVDIALAGFCDEALRHIVGIDRVAVAVDRTAALRHAPGVCGLEKVDGEAEVRGQGLRGGAQDLQGFPASGDLVDPVL